MMFPDPDGASNVLPAVCPIPTPVDLARREDIAASHAAVDQPVCGQKYLRYRWLFRPIEIARICPIPYHSKQYPVPDTNL
jgi:hypothetical protein